MRPARMRKMISKASPLGAKVSSLRRAGVLQSFEGCKPATKPASRSFEGLSVTSSSSSDQAAGLVASLSPSKLCDTPVRRRRKTFVPRSCPTAAARSPFLAPWWQSVPPSCQWRGRKNRARRLRTACVEVPPGHLKAVWLALLRATKWTSNWSPVLI